MVRTISNVSISSEPGHPHVVPWGRNPDKDVFESTRTPFGFPAIPSEDKLEPLSGPNGGNITPRTIMNYLVPSKAPSQLSPLQQEPDTDWESRTERTGTSSRITESIDLSPFRGGLDDDDEAECEDAMFDPGLNIAAPTFVPAVQIPVFDHYGMQPPALAVPISRAPPPGLTLNRGIKTMGNAMVIHQMQTIQRQHQQVVVQRQHQQPPRMTMNNVGMVRSMNLNVPPLHIVTPQNVDRSVQGSPASGRHSGHHNPVTNPNAMNNMGFNQRMEHLSPVTANGTSSPVGYGQSTQGYMGAVPPNHSPTPLVHTRSPGFRPHSLHRPSQSPPRAPVQPQPVQARHGGFTPHTPQRTQVPQPPPQQQHVYRQPARYAAPVPSQPVRHQKPIDVQQMIRIGASLPTLLKQGLVVPFMKHQNGSRYIQEKLSMADSPLITSILELIIFEEKEIMNLSEDIFGNYVVQIFFEQHIHRNDKESAQWVQWLIKHLLTGNAFRLSRHIYGCRVIQKAFDCIPKMQSIRLIEEIKNEGARIPKLIRKEMNKEGRTVMVPNDAKRSSLELCILCHHGNHVVQKIITLGLPIAHIQFIVDCVASDIPRYSQHQYGCRIVQNIVNLYGYEGNKRVLREVVKRDNLLKLCRSQYGNYVIQHVLKLNERSHRKEYDQSGNVILKGWQHCPQQYRNDQCLALKGQVIETVFGNVHKLSMNKYGSNVVEKCLFRATDKQKDFLLDQLLGFKRGHGVASNRKDHGALLRQMADHEFANFVIQNIIKQCQGKQQQRMINAIRESVPNLKMLQRGKYIEDTIKGVQCGQNNKRYY